MRQIQFTVNENGQLLQNSWKQFHNCCCLNLWCFHPTKVITPTATSSAVFGSHFRCSKTSLEKYDLWLPVSIRQFRETEEFSLLKVTLIMVSMFCVSTIFALMLVFIADSSGLKWRRVDGIWLWELQYLQGYLNS